jgi:hypothetical protein
MRCYQDAVSKGRLNFAKLAQLIAHFVVVTTVYGLLILDRPIINPLSSMKVQNYSQHDVSVLMQINHVATYSIWIGSER